LHGAKRLAHRRFATYRIINGFLTLYRYISMHGRFSLLGVSVMPSFTAFFSAGLALAIATGIPFASGMLESFTAILSALN
jgi:hypothetical protein